MDISKELHKGEKLEGEFTPSPWSYVGHYFVGFLLLALWIIPGVVYVFIMEGIRRGTRYYVTNKRVIRRVVFVTRSFSSTSYSRIQDVHLTQGILERIFKIGKVHLNTAGSYEVEIVFSGLEHPTKVKKMIDKHLH